MTRAQKRLAKTAIFLNVRLDAEVFDWLYEFIEAKHRQRRYQGWIPWYDAMVERAYEQFTTAKNPPPPAGNGDTSHRRVIQRRKVAKRKSSR